jgi:hypothetical protein
MKALKAHAYVIDGMIKRVLDSGQVRFWALHVRCRIPFKRCLLSPELGMAEGGEAGADLWRNHPHDLFGSTT